jgi:hypothetical protein
VHGFRRVLLSVHHYGYRHGRQRCAGRFCKTEKHPLMTRALARLSARRIYTAKPKGRVTRGAHKGKPRDTLMLCDGGGLYAQITLGK